MVLYYSTNTINKYVFNCIYIWINTVIICIFSVSSVTAPKMGTQKICKGLERVHVPASYKNRQFEQFQIYVKFLQICIKIFLITLKQFSINFQKLF